MNTKTITPPSAEEHAKRFRETHVGKGLTDKQIDDICATILNSQKVLLEFDPEQFIHHQR